MTSPTLDWPPHITVASIISRDDKFLIVEELSDGEIVYNQPAGHVEPNESILQAIQRETLEETGWQFLPKAIVGIYYYVGTRSGVTYLRICFTGEVDNFDANKTLDTGIIRTVWLTRDELAQQATKLRSPMVLKCIDDYLANIRYPLNLISDFRKL